GRRSSRSVSTGGSSSSLSNLLVARVARALHAHWSDPSPQPSDAQRRQALRWPRVPPRRNGTLPRGRPAMSAEPIKTESNAADAALPPGVPEQIGQYRVLRLLGQGAMGSVFEAEQARPKR